MVFFISACSFQEIDDRVTSLNKQEIENNTTIEQVFRYGRDFVIGSYFIDEFTISKGRNERISNEYINIIKEYDILYVYGIERRTFTEFSDMMLRLESHDYIVRSGDLFSMFIYNKNNLKFDKELILEDNIFTNEPHIVRFNVSDNKIITLIGVNINNRDATMEIRKLDSLYNSISKNNKNVIIMGNLYADCLYHNTNDLQDYIWLINETTKHRNMCVYDNIIVKQNIYRNILDYGVFSDVNNNYLLSSHYPIHFTLSS